MENTNLVQTQGGEIAHGNTTDMIFDHGAFGQMEKLANIMAGGKATVPAHLRDNPADCLAIIMQAAQWRMNPFAVAQKTHMVSGTLGYEAQLVNAVVSCSGAISGAFEYEFFGPWEKVIGKFVQKPSKNGGTYLAPDWSAADEKGCGVKITATLAGEKKPRTLELLLSQAQVRNSTLWASDPKQQLAYLGVKRWARLYAPAAILGVYSVDELDQPVEREINPAPAPAQAEVELPEYTQEMLNASANKWANSIDKGRDPAELVAMLKEKYTVSDEIVQQILTLNCEVVENA